MMDCKQALTEAMRTLQEHPTIESAYYFKHQDAETTRYGLYTSNKEERPAYEAFKAG